MFEGYDDNQPVNEIQITGPDGGEEAVWYDDDLRLRLAALDLLHALEAQTDAAQAVIDAWAKGDLAEAVRALDGSIAAAAPPSPRRSRRQHSATDKTRLRRQRRGR